MTTLTAGDLHLVLSRLPRDIINILKANRLFLAGGFIRSTIAGESPSDIDLFGESRDKLRLIALSLTNERRGRLWESQNAFTVLAPPRFPVQFITRWLYTLPTPLIESFDYTIAQAVIWYEDEKWRCLCSENFYSDLAARRLVYTFPKRNEDAGGSILRMRKFLRAGYNIQAPSIAGVVVRLMRGIGAEKIDALTGGDERAMAEMVTNLLREVDPLTVIQGCEIVDEHEVLA